MSENTTPVRPREMAHPLYNPGLIDVWDALSRCLPFDAGSIDALLDRLERSPEWK